MFIATQLNLTRRRVELSCVAINIHLERLNVVWLQVRIYSEDEARFTVRELKQWLHYMLLAGVEHFYVCDHYAAESERLDGALSRYIAAGLVTYIPWGHRSAGRTPLTAQTRCYRRLVTLYRRRHRWQIAVDVDEYPFSPNDTRENFIARYLDQVPDDVSEVGG